MNGLTEYWGNSYSYDAWGSLLQKNVTKCSAENLNVVAAVSNQMHTLSGPDYLYDAAGNMTHDATTANNYSYDQENRITGAAGYTYTYDADGNRVEKSNGTTGTIYWYMSPGIVAESDLTGTLKSEYVFFDGERVARKDLPANSVFYYFSDHLKTASVITDSAGTIKEDEDFYPWGGELQFVNNDSNHYKFTSKERDSETGLDYFGARYYANWTGRFLTPDWAARPITVPYANFGNPQSLNLYRYAQNNPTTFGDPDGHCDICQILLQKATGWIADGVARDGSGSQFAKNTATGLGKGAANFFIKWDNGNRRLLNKIGGHYKPIQEYKPSNVTEQRAMGAGEGAASLSLAVGGARGGTEPLPNEAVVVRGGSANPGGANSVEGIAAGTDTHPSGVTGFSVESAAGKSVEQLIQESPTTSRYGRVGCCTVGQVREAGGDVVPTRGQSPNHATVTGITPQQGNGLLTPTIPNPVKKPGGQ